MAVVAARVAGVAGATLWGLSAALTAYGPAEVWLWATDVAVTVAFAVLAAAALPTSWPTAVLAGSVSITWALGSLVPATTYWHRGALIVLIVSIPLPWPRTALPQTIAAVGAAVSFTPFIWMSDAWAVGLAVAFAAAVGVAAGRGLLSNKRVLGPAILLAALVTFGALAPEEGAVLQVRAVVYALGLVVVAGWLARAIPRTSVVAATDRVALAARGGGLRERLAVATGDPDLQIAWWEDGRWVGDAGGSVDASRSGSRTVIAEVDGEPAALAVTDAAHLSDPVTVEALSRTLRLAAAGRRLTADLANRADDVAASRARMLAAGDAERREVQRRLDSEIDRPLAELEQRLAGPTGSNDRSGEALGRARELVSRTRAQLSDLARGLPPPELAGGLADALTQLAARAPVPTTVRIEGTPSHSSETLYFVCAEAVANAVKHAEAGEISIEAVCDHEGDRLVVADSGRGGAIPRSGSGLTGLVDRVAAIGGSLTLESPAGGGTRLVVSLPARSAAESLR